MLLKFLFIIIITLLLNGGDLDAKLIDHYKKGVLRLSEDPSFGKGTDWVELFYDGAHGFIMAPDGSFFVNNNNQHSLSKFSPEGKYLFTFSQKGEGAGDVYRPAHPFIIDNRYLVVNEYSERLRINIFDFSGKYVKIVRPKHYCFDMVPLRNNIIAYTHKQPVPTPGPKIRKTDIYALDIGTGNITRLMTVETPRDYARAGRGFVVSEDTIGYLYIGRTKFGNLLVGLSHQPDIKIFSPDGKFIKSFRVNIQRIKATNELLEKKRKSFLAKLDRNEKMPPDMKKVLKESSNPPIGDYYPYYKNILLDSEGNILLQKYTDCVEDQCPLVFSVYSPEGIYVCDFRIEKGIYDFEFNKNRQSILFTERGIFALISYDDGEDIVYKLARIIPK